ncbi:MAG: hypothetical protein ACR2QB_09210 [Gammaproteobacteria bacterium]
MPTAQIFILLSAIGSLLPSAAADTPRLELAQVIAQPDDETLLLVDGSASLKIRLEARFECGDPDAVAGLFVSVADSVVSAPQVISPQAVQLTIPPQQTRGVRESLACPRPGTQLLRDQLTAFGTLTCRNSDGRARTATISQSLDVWADCGNQAAPAEPRAGEESLRDE